MGLRALQEEVDRWIRTVGVRYFSEMTNLAILMEEVGEVARIFARRYGDQVPKQNEPPMELAEELADVLFVLLCLANQTGVDLEAAFRQKMTARTQRDARRHRENPKLARPSGDETSE